MAMPLFANRKPRVQFRDGIIFVEVVSEGIDGSNQTLTLALTRHAARSLANSIAVSDATETAEIHEFGSRAQVTA